MAGPDPPGGRAWLERRDSALSARRGVRVIAGSRALQMQGVPLAGHEEWIPGGP